MRRFPDWLHKERTPGSVLLTSRILEDSKLHTVCESARCPNRQECFACKTATFMILGDRCTRSCRFCSVETGHPLAPDADEPRRDAEAALKLGLKHIVVTSVTRDDLDDGGAKQFCQTILAIRDLIDGATIEVLTPDFNADANSLRCVCDGRPDIFNHNLETVERLTPLVRSPNAGYRKSLKVLSEVKKYYPATATKSGIMLGLGEAREEVLETMRDLRNVSCDLLTIGQYLQPRQDKMSVQEFVLPTVFQEYERLALEMGFREAYCRPFVRSSYHADIVGRKMRKKERNYVYA